MSDDYSGLGKFRSLSGPENALERFLLCSLTLVGAAWAGELHVLFHIAFFKEQYLGLFLGLALPAVFLSVKARSRELGNRVPWRLHPSQ